MGSIRTRYLVALLPLLALSSGCNRGAGAEEEGQSGAEGSVGAVSGPGGRIAAVSGPGGVQSTALAEGTFLGTGAKLDGGQDIETPKGTLAEVELASGTRVRLNEATAVELPGGEHPGRLILTRGEVVVIAGSSSAGSDASGQLSVSAGDETLRVYAGEAQIRNSGATRRYAVVHGRAVLETSGQTLELGAGESIDAPLPAERTPPTPELSIRALDETQWARTFDAAARMADEVPRGVGSLTARRPGSQTEQQRLTLTHQHVTVDISGRIAHTEVEQAFFNDAPAVLEGIYRFPLPADGSISGLGLLVGNTWMQGEVVEKQRGRAIFQQIVDATIPRDPALLEWERGNVFKLRIFPIPGRGERRVRLSWTQVLPVVGGKLRYRYPLGGTGATATPIDQFSFTVNIDRSDLGDADLTELTTPMLALERRDQGSIVELHTERERFTPTFDLGVDIPLAEPSSRVHATRHLDRDGQAYFMLALQPELELRSDERPVHYAFVLDRSHSTTPELWTAARGIVDATTEMMDEADRFTVLACDSACDEHPEGLQAPASTVVDRAQAFLERQDLAGSSDLGGALLQAGEALSRGELGARKVIVYLGDGAPTSGELAADKLASMIRTPLGDTRVLAVAMGARSDLTTLGAVAQATGGDLIQADARDDLRNLVRELRLRAVVPAVHDLEFELPAGMQAVRQHGVSALRPGDSVILAGKLHHDIAGDVKMRARGPDGPVEATFRVDLAASGGGTAKDRHLPRTWAQMEIEHLTRTRGFDARDEIVGLSQDYTVLSRFTSLLVLENDAMYREFNVVRNAKNVDTWKGELPEVQSEAKPGEGAARPAPAGQTAGVVGGEPRGAVRGVEDVENEKSKRDEGGGSSPGSSAGFFSPDPPPPPASPPADPAFGAPSQGDEDVQAKVSDAPVEITELDLDRDDDETADGDLLRSARSRSAPASPPKATNAKKKSKRSSAADDPLSGLGGTGTGRGGGGWAPEPEPTQRRWSPPTPRLTIRTDARGAARLRDQTDRLRAAVQADPTKRSAHGQLVRTAQRAGHPEALAFAQAWAEVDPDHAEALLALADAMAAAGDPLALRAYDSVVEIRPFSDDQHRMLAIALESKGDLTRACSHRRALVSIDPSRGSHHADLATCLRRAGRIADSRSVVAEGESRASKEFKTLTKIAADLERGVLPEVSLHSGAQLRATLSWSGEDDLDIAIIDRNGRRLSALHPDGVRVREGGGSEQLTVQRVRGSMFVEVSRHGVEGSESPGAPIRAELELRTPGTRRKVALLVREGSARVATVAWTGGSR